MKDAAPGKSILEDLEKRVGDLEEMTSRHEIFINLLVIGLLVLGAFSLVGVLWL